MTGQQAGRRVVILDTGYTSYAGEETLLREAGYTLDIFSGGRHDTPTKLAFAAGAEGAFVRWTELDSAAFD